MTNASPEVSVRLDPKTNGIRLSVTWGPLSSPHTQQWQWQLCGTPDKMTLVPVIDDHVHASFKGRHGSLAEVNPSTRTEAATQSFHSLDDSWQRRDLESTQTRHSEEDAMHRGSLRPKESSQDISIREQPRVHFSKRVHRVRHEDSARPRAHSVRYDHEPSSIMNSDDLSRRAAETNPTPRTSVIVELPIRNKYEEPKHRSSSRRRERRTEYSPDAHEHRSRDKRGGHGHAQNGSRERRRGIHYW